MDKETKENVWRIANRFTTMIGRWVDRIVLSLTRPYSKLSFGAFGAILFYRYCVRKSLDPLIFGVLLIIIIAIVLTISYLNKRLEEDRRRNSSPQDI